MRGTHIDIKGKSSQVRIIPADAGNTVGTRHLKNSSSHHPRGCGEHGAADMIRHIGSGSSPRMRGTQTEDYRFTPVIRIIPADAGNTCWDWPSSRTCRDHPRGCGEHLKAPSTLCLLPGSSQRMRGTLVSDPSTSIDPGIIPADAGNTSIQGRSKH